MASARLVVLALFVVGCQSWKLPAVPAGRRAQFYTQQSDGAYKYGYDTAEGLYQEQEADSANEVQGKFGADGGLTRYTAGVGGYAVTSYKEPTASAVATKSYNFREATLEELSRHPEPVADTAEVAQAKAKFQADYAAAAAAAEAAPDVNIITGASPVIVEPAPHFDDNVRYYGPLAEIDAEGNVLETAEVKAAKEAHLAVYSAAAAAAEASPDASIIPAPAPIVEPAALYSAPAVAAPAPVAVVRLDAEGNLLDTPEVAAAKAQFEADYAAAAAAAAAAPDTGIITGPAPVVLPSALYSAPVVAAPAPVAVVRLDAEGNLLDTPEVAAAKAQFEADYAAAAAAADAAPDVNIITGPAPVAQPLALYAAPAPVAVVAPAPVAVVSLDAEGNVQDTAEVAAAKAKFQADYAAAAAAAEAAPDVNIITGASPVIVEPAPHFDDNVRYYGPLAEIDAEGNVLETAEVKAAKQAHLAVYSAAAAAAEASPDVAIIPAPAPAPVVLPSALYSAPVVAAPAPVAVVRLDAEGNLLDTPEVAAAKAQFQADYAAAAAAADAAPDTGIITGPAPVAEPAALYSAPAVAAPAAAAPADHGDVRTYSFDGITVMDGGSAAKYGYSYE